MRVLITGVAGFIGSRLAEAMLAHGHEVAGLDNLSTGLLANVPEGVDFHRRDVRAPINFDQRFDAIYHCAASYKDREAWAMDADVNVLGTINVVRRAQQDGAKLVYFQTSLCYGPNPASPVTLDAPLNPVGSYAVSKTAGEAYIRDSKVPYVSLRLANMYGPRNLSGPVPTFWKRITGGQTCTVVESRRDFVFVDDLIWVAVNAATKGEGAYHIASGTDKSIAELYAAVVQAMGVRAPEPLVVPRGPDDVATILLDPSRTLADFGWTARTSLEDGIAKAVQWYEEHGVAATYTHLAQKG
jgi:UDP-glucose 4-epimerase